MDLSPRFSLPYIAPNQAQKHVTHNEAIRMLDVFLHMTVRSRIDPSPPLEPPDGTAYLVPVGRHEGVFKDQENKIAVFRDGEWVFFQPLDGWRVFVADEQQLLVQIEGNWQVVGYQPRPRFDAVGIGADATSDNLMTLVGGAALLSHGETGDIRLKLNRQNELNNALVEFQTDFEGRFLLGVEGDSLWRIRASVDGSNWRDCFSVNPNTGHVGIGDRPSDAPLDVTSRTEKTGFEKIARLAVWNASMGRKFTQLSIAQNSVNEVVLDVADHKGTRGNLALQPFGGNVHIGSGGGRCTFPELATTASSPNAHLAADRGNQVLRSTSSQRYKKDIEPVDMTKVRTLLEIEPVWFRSTAAADNPKWSWYGFIAEDLAAVEPRLVHWRSATRWDQSDRALLPDGVAYDRFVVLHHALLKEISLRLDKLEDAQQSK